MENTIKIPATREERDAQIKAMDVTRENIHEMENGRGRVIGFVKQCVAGHWSSYSYTAGSGWSHHPNKEHAIAEVRRQHEGAAGKAVR